MAPCQFQRHSTELAHYCQANSKQVLCNLPASHLAIHSTVCPGSHHLSVLPRTPLWDYAHHPSHITPAQSFLDMPTPCPPPPPACSGCRDHPPPRLDCSLTSDTSTATDLSLHVSC